MDCWYKTTKDSHFKELDLRARFIQSGEKDSHFKDPTPSIGGC